jgi:hypothetical protein
MRRFSKNALRWSCATTATSDTFVRDQDETSRNVDLPRRSETRPIRELRIDDKWRAAARKAGLHAGHHAINGTHRCMTITDTAVAD